MPKHIPTLNQNKLIAKVRSQFLEPQSNTDVALYLQNISYYDLVKGYKNTPFKDINNQFIKGIDINILYQIHWIDMSLGNLLLKFSLETEKHLKSVLSTIVTGFGNDPEHYLNERYYRNASTKVLDNVRAMISKDLDGSFAIAQESFGTVPAWYAINKVSFGQAINWYARLRSPSKLQIAKSLLRPPIILSNLSEQDELDMLRSFLKYILEVRNKAAHGSRILNLDIQEIIQTRWVKYAGIEEYFATKDNGQILRTIPNYLTIIMLLTDIPLFGINVLNETVTFLKTNSLPGANPFPSQLSVTNLYGISQNDIDRLKELLKMKFDPT